MQLSFGRQRLRPRSFLTLAFDIGLARRFSWAGCLSKSTILPLTKALGIVFAGGAGDVKASGLELAGPLWGLTPGFLADSKRADLSSPGLSL